MTLQLATWLCNFLQRSTLLLNLFLHHLSLNFEPVLTPACLKLSCCAGVANILQSLARATSTPVLETLVSTLIKFGLELDLKSLNLLERTPTRLSGSFE